MLVLDLGREGVGRQMVDMVGECGRRRQHSGEWASPVQVEAVVSWLLAIWIESPDANLMSRRVRVCVGIFYPSLRKRQSLHLSGRRCFTRSPK